MIVISYTNNLFFTVADPPGAGVHGGGVRHHDAGQRRSGAAADLGGGSRPIRQPTRQGASPNLLLEGPGEGPQGVRGQQGLSLGSAQHADGEVNIILF